MAQSLRREAGLAVTINELLARAEEHSGKGVVVDMMNGRRIVGVLGRKSDRRVVFNGKIHVNGAYGYRLDPSLIKSLGIVTTVYESL